MEPEIYYYLERRNDLWHFIRKNPEWYRQLSRNDESIAELQKESKQYYGKTLPQRLEKTQQNIQLIRMIMSMAGAYRD
ncbi:YlbE-like family protein [Gracilibacillus marinus]|jgi:hypothetical protein|uniref:YlbE-like family protein n=1 Tax=Gracilibacillus marinus TaxID=630535 RepID=A0ABV8VS54_9BACI